MRWLTLPEVAEHMLEIPSSTARARRAAGEFEGIVTKRVGAQVRYHPEAAWFYACHGRPAGSLDEAYAWAEAHPLPDIDQRGARLVREAS
jgi:hypothetical protein